MASPFKIFQKNQKLAIAIVMVMCMFSFVFIPIIDDFFIGQQTNAEQVAVTTSFGKVDEMALQSMVQERYRLNAFMSGILSIAYGQPVENPFFEPATEQSVIQSMILNRKADELGIVVSDKAVNQFLKTITGDRVTSDDMRTLMQRLGMSQFDLFDQLRREIRVMKLRQSVLGGLNSTVSAPPAQRWEYYQRVNRRATIELAPLAVADFTSQVAEPTADQIVKFYEKYKDRYWDPDSPEPGFHQPQRANVQYLLAEYDNFYKPEDVPMEDVQKHYDEFKDQLFLFTDLGGDEFEVEETEETPATDEAGNQPSAEGTPAEESKPEEQPASTPEEDAAQQPSEPNAAEPPATTPESTPADEPPSPNLQALNGGTADPIIVRGQNADESTRPAATAPDGPALPAAGDESQTEAPAESSAEGSTAETPAADTPASPAGETPAATPPAETPPGAPPIGDDLILPERIQGGPAPTYEPLWKVEDRIRRTLATERASEKMEQVLKSIQQTLGAYARERDEWKAGNSQTKLPPPPDFAALAKEHGLTSGETGMLSAVEFERSTDIGNARVAGGTPFADFIFEGNVRLYMPMMAQDSSSNQYLFWKIAEEPDLVPKLEDIRDKVVTAWKMMEARAVAKKKAEQLVAEANKAKKPLAEVFTKSGDPKVTDAGPFTWLTFGAMQAFAPDSPPRISTVSGVENPGEHFMQAVFSLKPGEVGVASNAPETYLYVVRVEQFEPLPDVLRATFLADNYQRYRMVGVQDFLDLNNRWTEEVDKEVHLDWVRPATRNLRRR